MDTEQPAFRISNLSLLKTKRDSSLIDEPNYINGARKVLQYLYVSWRKGLLCDVILKLSNGEIKAHKVALASYSRMLGTKFKGSSMTEPEATLLDLTEFDSDAVMTVLYFIYTTEIEINDYNVAQILLCARELGVEVVEQMCEDYLNRYTVENALLYYSIAERYGFVDLATRIYAFICDKFLDVVATASFCYVPIEKLCMLLSEDKLNVENEIDIFHAVLRWMDYDKQNRRPDVVQALCCVRFHLLPPEVIVTEVESVEWLMDSGIFKFLYSLMRYGALHYSGSRMADQYKISELGERKGKRETGQQTRLARGISPPRTVLAGGGAAKPASRHVPSTGMNPNQNNNSVKEDVDEKKQSIEERSLAKKEKAERKLRKRDISEKRHTKKDTNKDTDSTSDSRFPPFQLMAVGGVDLEGLDSEVPGRSVATMMSKTGEWTVHSLLPDYVHHHGAVVSGNKLYIIGGAVMDMMCPGKLGNATSSVYQLEIQQYSWQQMESLHKKRAYVSVAATDNMIFAVGGEDEKKRKLDSVEVYDVEQGRWRYLARMPGGARLGSAVSVHERCLYVIGGYTGEVDKPILDDVLCFDLQKEKWVLKKPLPVPRCHASLVSIEKKLLLIGGRHKFGQQPNAIILSSASKALDSLGTVELYDVTADSWSLFATMSEARHDCSSAAIGSRLYIVGGMKSPSPTCLKSVECLDVQSRQWIAGVPAMPYPAAGTGCCVVYSQD